MEIILACLACVAAFSLAALVSLGAQGRVPALLLGLALLAGVLAVARFSGVVYAVPVGVVTIQAFDWYFLPPYRALDAETVFVLGIFIVTSVLVAEIASRAGRRATASEEARGVLADEQAALRRVATLVAQGVPPTEVFAAVAEEVGRLVSIRAARIIRYEADGTATVISAWTQTSEVADKFEVGTRLTLDGESVTAAVLRTGRPASMDGYANATGSLATLLRDAGVRSSIGAPIVVEGRLWGVIVAASTQEPLPAGTGSRLAGFTELVATAISNAEARGELERVAAEQAALRRVATLVAEGATADLYSAVAREVALALDVPVVTLGRYESDATSTVLTSLGDRGLPIGSRWPLDGPSLGAAIFETGRPARIDDYSDLSGPVAAATRLAAIGSTVGVPISVDGKVWGLMCVGTTGREPLPADTEDRLARFTALVATAVSNATARAELAASRARVVAAADETRRRLERDLHDGIQQRLVTLALKVRATETMTPHPSAEIQGELAFVADGLGAALDELREISRGIHPAILSEGGLGPAFKALARRSAIPVTLDLQLDSRLAEPLEVAAYYVASEAFTNAVKHAQASAIELHVDCRDGVLTVSIRDDGIGGADLSRGTGLIGLTDRVEALGGTISVLSPPGDGTALQVQLPVHPGAAPTPPRDARSTRRAAAA
jgi:signal transduction histidine kinase